MIMIIIMIMTKMIAILSRLHHFCHDLQRHRRNGARDPRRVSPVNLERGHTSPSEPPQARRSDEKSLRQYAEAVICSGRRSGIHLRYLLALEKLG